MIRLPHPLVLMLGGIAIAAALTWILPAGEFDRRDDPVTGRKIAVAGSYHRVEPQPVGPLAAIVSIPRGFVEGGEVIAVVLFVGGAWVLVDRLGTMTAVVGALVGFFQSRGFLAIPLVSAFFATMGALENMEEEIIPLMPVLLLLGNGLGIDPVAVVAMSGGAAMIGSAFGPTNPFQAGIALKLAQLPPLSGGLLRLIMFLLAVGSWIAFTTRYVAKTRTAAVVPSHHGPTRLDRKHAISLAAMLTPMALYVYGALRLDWGLNELSAAFFIGAIVAGMVGGLGLAQSLTAYLDGMKELLPAAFMVGLARSISLVLTDGRVVDSILNTLASQLAHLPAVATAFLMVPVQALIHVAVPSVSGQAVLTMPLMVPLADLLGFSRQVPVLAYQVGGGLAELFTPTNGALMAILLGANVPYDRWLKFASGAVIIPVLVGLAGIAAAVWFRI
ncbi:MAG TPA: hypothetical protein VF456_01095 [Vicinamibacterales bacterium]